tara:strand:- start:326 stop:484 length:159 start_codon:yes stop_codon:yes gene_type:complete
MTKEEREYKEGVASYNEWNRDIKRLEKRGLHGTDYYIRRVEQLEAQLKRRKK